MAVRKARPTPVQYEVFSFLVEKKLLLAINGQTVRYYHPLRGMIYDGPRQWRTVAKLLKGGMIKEASTVVIDGQMWTLYEPVNDVAIETQYQQIKRQQKRILHLLGENRELKLRIKMLETLVKVEA